MCVGAWMFVGGARSTTVQLNERWGCVRPGFSQNGAIVYWFTDILSWVPQSTAKLCRTSQARLKPPQPVCGTVHTTTTVIPVATAKNAPILWQLKVTPGLAYTSTCIDYIWSSTWYKGAQKIKNTRRLPIGQYTTVLKRQVAFAPGTRTV